MLRKSLALIILALAFATATGCASSRSLDKSVADIGANAGLKAVLFSDRSHDYSDVDITLFEGRLMLTGTMRSEDGRRRLIENAWKVSGVEQVIDEIFVGDKTPFGQGFEDSRIDAALRARLIGDEDVESGRFKTSVSGGVVYFLGVAPNQTAIDEAVAHARAINGVSQVVSHMTLKAQN
jgi:osmotically-inducible protein OsmY